MGKHSHIEWTHHTFNPWWGCTKVSPACTHCYAETWAKRVGEKVWGARAPRRFFTDHHWNEPTIWNADAARRRTRERVFCASMADVFEDRSDLDPSRERLWKLIVATPALDWLLLTKRPENIAEMIPWSDDWPQNVWLGTTVENQEFAEKRLPHLLKHKAACRFLSSEPLLGALDLTPFKVDGSQSIDWIIAGGESGPQARPMDPAWLRQLRDFCKRRRISFHFKQWGHWVPAELAGIQTARGKTMEIGPKKEKMVALGKKEAGRMLDGKTYDEFPLLRVA